ncbi:MAG: phenylalanine--tRNA ligase beta subunit-related protein [Planctomycetota bacterium]|nr:phenylalanine--tRNA ligase beta subunit-related protein [Planctomycetota bacterium]
MTVQPDAQLDVRGFITRFPDKLGNFEPALEVTHLFALDAAVPVQSSDQIRACVRDLLRAGGFKPAGRNKPASEYLRSAASAARLSSINLAVDVCNVVSLHSGLPMSVVDLERVKLPLRVAVAEKSSSYVFNLSGQVIDVGGIWCLHDALGPCANAVKDAQRTKTSPMTRQTVSLFWSAVALADQADAAEAWYRTLLESRGCQVECCKITVST